MAVPGEGRWSGPAGSHPTASPVPAGLSHFVPAGIDWGARVPELVVGPAAAAAAGGWVDWRAFLARYQPTAKHTSAQRIEESLRHVGS